MSTIKSDVGRSWAFSGRNKSNRVDASNASNSQVRWRGRMTLTIVLTWRQFPEWTKWQFVNVVQSRTQGKPLRFFLLFEQIPMVDLDCVVQNRLSVMCLSAILRCRYCIGSKTKPPHTHSGDGDLGKLSRKWTLLLPRKVYTHFFLTASLPSS